MKIELSIADIYFLGMLTTGITSILCTTTNAIDQKTWKVKDYEKIITKYIKPHDTDCVNDLLIVEEARNKTIKKELNNIKKRAFIYRMKKKIWKKTSE